MIIKCGCAYETHSLTGAMRRTARCAGHERAFRDPSRLDGAYYSELSNHRMPGRGLVTFQHVTEMGEALGSFPPAGANPRCIEVGCGVSAYVGELRQMGWHYVGVDASKWALKYTAEYWRAHTINADWEFWRAPWKVGLIIAAHSLEHMLDAPMAVQKAADTLDTGGHLFVLVPDDKDPANPDHNWLFNEDSLCRTVELAGLKVVNVVRKSIVRHEDFLYLRAVK